MSDKSSRDLLGSASGSFIAWWLPLGAMLLAIPLPNCPKTVIWLLALVWMGGACLLNARRCGRVHCRYTGPYLLAMTCPVLGHGTGLVPLGGGGWQWLGLAVGGGTAAICGRSERFMGRYR
ncbi:hypothetical protein [uncultured Jannaschia sp.]|uniref:hypothetical protein n=1 Tax=uncultured Jannaschia sp. TaxID=293347 RepID=UPI00261DC36A|nr:hypothetical protein [uncultured Jannaschia sp.]